VSEQRRERVKDLLDQAASLPREQRRSFIELAAKDDSAVLAEALDLLATMDDSQFMHAPTGAGVANTVHNADAVLEAPGACVGRYKLLQRLGEGGFGAVFMAEQTEPVVRRVALKIIKAGMDTRQVIARFEAERQALAMMEHPCIARVLDAGATEQGRPFFVMELVRGEMVTHYCDREKLSVEDRLRLFQSICGAVQHAHQKGIIHRDIKPSNILVTVADGRPLPKVIDFGIAKAVAVRLTDKTLFTEIRQIIGTPEYMSPEQAEVSGVDIDTRSDVYSLGVLLYELLVGEPPFEGRRLRSAPFAEMQRIIRDEEPPRPSARLRTKTGSSSVVQAPLDESPNKQTGSSVIDIARRRRTEPVNLARSLRGDLDWIVMKCLEKDRNRRYDTANDLVSDIQRYLLGQPVSAAPPGRIYRAQKFMRRHRGVVATGLAVALAIVVGASLAVSGWLSAIEARDTAEVAQQAESRERVRAEKALKSATENEAKAQSAASKARREAAKSKAVSDFLQNLLESAEPKNARERRNVTVREAVDRAAKDLDAGRLAAQPEVEAVVRATIGRVYRSLGEDAKAQTHLERAIALMEEGVLSRMDLAVLRNDLGHVLRDRGDMKGAERVYLKALEAAKAAGEDGMAAVGGIYNSLAGVAMARKDLDAATHYYDEAIAAIGSPNGENLRPLLQARFNRSVLLRTKGDKAAAERELREVCDRTRAEFGDTEPMLVRFDAGLAITLADQGRADESLPIMRRALATARKVFGPKHPNLVYVLTQLGGLSLRAQDWSGAEEAYAEANELRRGLPEGERVPDSDALAGYALSIEMQHQPDRAEPIRREAVELARSSKDADETATALTSLGRNFLMQHHGADAEPVLREALELRRKAISKDDPKAWQNDYIAGLLGEALIERAEADSEHAAALLESAEPLVVVSAEALINNAHVPAPLPGLPDRKREAAQRAIRLFTDLGKAGGGEKVEEKIANWQAKLKAIEGPASRE